MTLPIFLAEVTKKTSMAEDIGLTGWPLAFVIAVGMAAAATVWCTMITDRYPWDRD